MQLCCRIRLELSEQIIPAKGSQEPLPNGGATDKAAFSEMIMEAELLILCEQGLRCVWHVPLQPSAPGRGASFFPPLRITCPCRQKSKL